MSLQKTEAIVLRSINQGETSKILTLYTRQRGKMAVIAKGARNVKSRFGGNLEPGTYLAIVYHAKENRDLQHLSQAELLNGFPAAKKDLAKTALSLATCELLDRIEAGQEPNALLFRLLLSALTHIDSTTGAPANIFRAYELHISDLMGFRPHFSDCISCHKHLRSKFVFDLGAGGLLCEDCHEPGESSIVLSSEALTALRTLQHHHISKLTGQLTGKTVQRSVDDFLSRFLRFHVDGLRELKALRFLSKI